jgi:hypothetical protein
MLLTFVIICCNCPEVIIIIIIIVVVVVVVVNSALSLLERGRSRIRAKQAVAVGKQKTINT